MNEALASFLARHRALSGTLEQLLRDAYDAGFRDGGLSMRDHILQAANAPVAIKAGSVSSASAVSAASASVSAAAVEAASSASPAAPFRSGGVYIAPMPSGSLPLPTPHQKRIATRAPRGLVRAAVEEALRDRPGASIVEVEDLVVTRYPDVARKSVGNQLRHFEGELYRREGKYKWFLMGDAQKETAREEDPLAAVLGSDERR